MPSCSGGVIWLEGIDAAFPPLFPFPPFLLPTVISVCFGAVDLFHAWRPARQIAARAACAPHGAAGVGLDILLPPWRRSPGSTNW